MTESNITTRRPGGWAVVTNEEHIAAAAAITNADLYSAAIDVRGFDEIDIEITIESTGDPVGSLYVQAGRSSTVATHGPIKLDKVQCTAGVTHSAGDAAIAVADPAADATINLTLAGLPDGYLSIFWDRTSGGAASAGMTIKYTKRARKEGAQA